MIENSFYVGKISLAIKEIMEYIKQRRDIDIKNAKNVYEQDELVYRYNIKPEEVWVEHPKKPIIIDNKFLLCIFIHNKGLGFLDCYFSKTTYNDFLNYLEFDIPSYTNQSLLSDIKSGNINTRLIRLNNKLALVHNRNDKQESLIKALGDPTLDSLSINYDSINPTNNNLVIGSCVLRHHFIDDTKIDLVDVEEIKNIK